MLLNVKLVIFLMVFGNIALSKAYTELRSTAKPSTSYSLSPTTACGGSAPNVLCKPSIGMTRPSPDAYDCPINETNAVTRAFLKYAIVPQIIPCPPTQKVFVKEDNIDIDLGNYIPAFTIGYYPYAVYWAANPTSLYAVVFANVDTNFALYGTYELLNLSQLVVNVPGDNLIAGDVLVNYRPYLPFPGNGPQRYIGLVYEQSERIDVTRELAMRTASSDKFNLSEFVNIYNLGNPIFGNFFVTSLSFCDNELLLQVCDNEIYIN